MSDLQIGLVALGVLLIVAVLGLNWWQDRRARLHVHRQFASLTGEGSDPLLEPITAGRREPGLGAQQDVGSNGRHQDGRHQDAYQDLHPDLHQDSHQDSHQDPQPTIDPACEVVIDLSFTEPVSGAALRSALRGWHEVGGKPLRFFAKSVESTADETYHVRLRDDVSYSALQLALLLANRSGPVSAMDWSRCWNQAEQLAERFDAALEGPDPATVIAQAQRLDAFCAKLDVQVGLNLVMAHPQPVASVLALARELGFVLVDGRLLWLSDAGLVCFALSYGDAGERGELAGSFEAPAPAPVSRLLLLLDVPHSPANERAFSHMAQIGRDLAARLDAQLLDDQGKPVVAGSEAAIDAHLADLYAQLREAHMQAGSARARRVFS